MAADAATKVADAATKVAACVKHKSGCLGSMRKHWKTVSTVAFVILVGFAFLLTWLVLRPKNPHFTLQDMNLVTFNVSLTPPTVTSIIQPTISTRNPNQRTAIYYDKLDVHLVYRTQPITSSAMIPPSFQGHKDVITWSPFLYGSDVPLAPNVADSMTQDKLAKIVPVNVRASGILRWKYGSLISGKYHINVNCPTDIYFGKRDDGAFLASPEVRFPMLKECNVEV